ncbi:hypothetical protein TP2_03640 [Thioclava pacifica DSM 10166]|uniref:Uncharacterized protein n=1 Tax=Thioclava pacifica DSM 10166 TaxID=1353537 RepID=A0A074JXD8_9RHOB|nr:hypothetical protein TP2_03640 [Thioclava pacifica DSM 10166]
MLLPGGAFFGPLQGPAKGAKAKDDLNPPAGATLIQATGPGEDAEL